jgi:hypothetical protein
MSYLVLNIFYAVLLLSSVSTPFSVQLLFGPYVTRIGCLSILAQPSRDVITCWKNTARRTSRFARRRLTKNHKNQKSSRQRRQSFACFVVCLLTCKPSVINQILRSNLLSLLFSCCWFVVYCDEIIFLLAILFFLPPQISSFFVISCKVPVSEVPSIYHC